MLFLPAMWTTHCLNLASSCANTPGLLKAILASKFWNYTFSFFPFRWVSKLPVEYFTFLQNSLVWLWAAAQRHDGKTSARLFITVVVWHVLQVVLKEVNFCLFVCWKHQFHFEEVYHIQFNFSFFKNLQFSPSCLAWRDSKNNLIAQTVLLHYGHQMSPLYRNTAQPFFKFPINYRYLKLSFSLSKVIGDLLLLNKIVFHRPKVLLITCR